jgi:hypothetical protein
LALADSPPRRHPIDAKLLGLRDPAPELGRRQNVSLK